MPAKREVRDPIHGFIEYDETEERIINTQPFQRLRGIRQLALASVVYPGAHHTRFEHSLGAMHLAGKVADILELVGARRKTVRLAGLLHDIGHGPFSHVSEQVLERYAQDLPKKYAAENAHELMSILTILRHPELQRVLSDEQREDIVRLLQLQTSQSVDHDIVSGPLDVDKLDYLLRDSYFAGVRYGVFDIDKLTQSLVPIKIGVDAESLGITEEGIYALEQLLLAKYHMNAQVYQHRVRRITDAMLVRGIDLGLRDGVEGLSDAFMIEDSEEYVRRYSKFTDESLADLMLKRATGSSHEFFLRAKERRLLKEVFCVPMDSTAFPDAVMLSNLRALTREQMGVIAARAAREFSDKDNEVSPDMVIVDRQSMSNPTFRSPITTIRSSVIMVQSGETRQAFPEKSRIFKTDDPFEENLYIYLPLDWIEDKGTRRLSVETHREAMQDIVEEAAK